MLRKSLIFAFLMVVCASVYSQTSGGNHDVIQTVAGTLSISKVSRIKKDGVTFTATLNDVPFDQLYGSYYTYYTDVRGQNGAVARLLVQDFIGGFSDFPSVSLYDFRKKPPVVLPVSDKLDVDDVRWSDDSVSLSASGKWYKFSGGKLLPTPGRNQTWECTITRDGTEHDLTVQMNGESVVGFDYLATTRTEAGVNSCGVTTKEYKGSPKVSGNMTIFPLEGDGAATVMKNKKEVVVDLSDVRIMNYCGQLVTIAQKLTLRKGSRRCVSVPGR